MSHFRKVDTRIWNDARFRKYSDQGKLAFLFILTHPAMTSLGAMRGTVSGLAVELGWDVETLREAILDPCRDGCLMVREESSFIALANWFKYNIPEGPNAISKGWKTALEAIPECPEKAIVLRNAIVCLRNREWFKDDPQTRTILAYIEDGIRHSSRIREGEGEGEGEGEVRSAPRTTTKKSERLKNLQQAGGKKNSEGGVGKIDPSRIFVERLSARYERLRLAAGLDWPPKASQVAQASFQKAVALCLERGASVVDWLQYCAEEYPKFAGVKVPTPKHLTSAPMMEQFLVRGAAPAEVHESVRRRKANEDYPRELVEFMEAAGLDLPAADPPHIRGRLYKDVMWEVKELPRRPNLALGHEGHVCLLAGRENLKGLRAWAKRSDRPAIKKAWAEVVAFARARTDPRQRHCWEVVLQVADEVEKERA